MDPVARFEEYAQAFEEFFESDDTSILEPYFTEDAVLEVIADPPLAAKREGRDAIFANFKESVASLDKRFDSRELDLQNREEDGKVLSRFRLTLRKGDLAEAAISGESTTSFRGDRICHVEERFDPEVAKAFLAWMEQHGAALG